MADRRRQVAANDNPVWPWRGVCAACGGDMGPVRDSTRCRNCLAGDQPASTLAQDALWAMLLERHEIPPDIDSDAAAGPPRW